MRKPLVGYGASQVLGTLLGLVGCDSVTHECSTSEKATCHGNSLRFCSGDSEGNTRVEKTPCDAEVCVETARSAYCAESNEPAPVCAGTENEDTLAHRCDDTEMVWCAEGLLVERFPCLKCVPDPNMKEAECVGGFGADCATKADCVPELECHISKNWGVCY